MIPLPDLSHEELLALTDDMRLGPYIVKPTVQMLDRDHQVLSDLSARVTDGQVDCKLEGKISTRSCTVTLFDPRREIAVDGSDAADGALFYDKMIAAGVNFTGPRLGRWVTIPLFCGPMTNGSRAGWTTTVTGQGKERLATGMVWSPRTYPKGSDKYDTVADLLIQSGESPDRIIVPADPHRLRDDLVLARTDRAWAEVVSIVDSQNRQPLYDGRGTFRVRPWPQDPTVTFTDGVGGSFLTEPEVTYDSWEGFNGVWVRGPVTHAGKRVNATAWLPRNHPLSPWSLARGRTDADPDGIPFRMAYEVEDPHARTKAAAQEIADQWLRRLAQEIVTVKVDVLPNWLIEPGDVAAFTSMSLGRIEQVLNEFSLPLTVGTPMSLGATKVLRRPIPTPHQAKGHHHRKHHHKHHHHAGRK